MPPLKFHSGFFTPTLDKEPVFPVIKTQNTMLLDEFSAILTFFAFKDEKTEFVKLIFLTNSA